MRAISILMIITTAAVSACNEFDFSYECQNAFNNYDRTQTTIQTTQYNSKTGATTFGSLHGSRDYGYAGYAIDPITGQPIYMQIDRQGNVNSYR
jgi:uncharacterized protein (DUF2147 family)